MNYDGGPASGLSIADINHDGNPELLVGNGYGDVLVLLNQGNGTFFALITRPNQSIALAVDRPYGSGSNDVVYADQGLDRVVVHVRENKTDSLGESLNGDTLSQAPSSLRT